MYVRPTYIYKALEWLIENNILYKKIELDKNYMGKEDFFVDDYKIESSADISSDSDSD